MDFGSRALEIHAAGCGETAAAVENALRQAHAQLHFEIAPQLLLL